VDRQTDRQTVSSWRCVTEFLILDHEAAWGGGEQVVAEPQNMACLVAAIGRMGDHDEMNTRYLPWVRSEPVTPHSGVEVTAREVRGSNLGCTEVTSPTLWASKRDGRTDGQA
jgi:hypothetical protein